MKQIKLLQPHTHAGRDYPSGAVVEVESDSADWLIAIGVAEPVNQTKERK